MAQNIEIIETERLLLRGIDVADAEQIVNWRSKPDVYMYFKSPHQITLDEHLNWYSTSYLSNANRFDWMCVEREKKDRIGVFGLYKDQESAEVNYLLDPRAQHKGYATEAIRALIEYAFEKWGSKRILAEIHKENKASIELVKRLGFRVVSQDNIFVVYGLEA